MPANLTANMISAMSSPTMYPVLLCDIALANANINMWSGFGNIVYNGTTYLGMGRFAKISSPQESSQVEAQGITLQLSGEDFNANEVEIDARSSLPVTVYFGCFNANRTLVDSPFVLWKGVADAYQTHDDGSTCTITCNAENFLVNLQAEPYRRFTDADHQQDLPATLTRLGLPANTVDDGFQFVTSITSEALYWGTVASSSNNV